MIRLLSLNLQHAKPGHGGAGHRLIGPWVGQEVGEPARARAVLQVLAEQIAALSPDVITLQEVDVGQHRSGGVHQARELAALLGWPTVHCAATYAGGVSGLRHRPLRADLGAGPWDSKPPVDAGRTCGPRGFGNAILSRFPASWWGVQRLGRGPALVVPRGEDSPRPWDPRTYRVVTASARAQVAATLRVPLHALVPGAPGSPELPGSAGAHRAPSTRPTPPVPAGRDEVRSDVVARPAHRPVEHGTSTDDDARVELTVSSVHLATRTDVACRQLAAAWAALATRPGPHVLAGDLNLRPDHLAPLGIARELGQGATFPASSPRHRIDHVLTDPWPCSPGGVPVGPDAAWPGQGLLVAADWGCASLVVSDHAATWVDLAYCWPGEGSRGC